MWKCVVLSCASTFFNTAHLCGAKAWGPESPLKPTAAESFSFVLAQRSFPPMPSLSTPLCLASAPKQVLGLEGQPEVGCSPSVCEALGPCTTTEQSLGPNLAWTKERGKNRACRFIYQASAGTQGGLQVFDFSQDEWRIPEYTTRQKRTHWSGTLSEHRTHFLFKGAKGPIKKANSLGKCQ